MSKMIVAYWSQTGNTAAMAEAIGRGITEGGKEAVVAEISSVSMDELKEADVFALGCPAMGAEVLEEAEMEPFVMEVETFAAGKKIALFGSYGWGDGCTLSGDDERNCHDGNWIFRRDSSFFSASDDQNRLFSKYGYGEIQLLNIDKDGTLC